MTKQLFHIGDTLRGWSLEVSLSTNLYVGIALHHELIMGHQHWYCPVHLGPLTLLITWTR